MPQNFQIKTTYTAVDKSTRVIGKIQSRITRMTAKASMGMRKLDRAMGRVRGVVNKGLKIGFAAASGAAIGLFAAVSKTASSMDQLAKKARTIEFPIEEFQEWRFVAEQSGVSTDVFEKSMQKFSRVIGDLKAGRGSLFSTLKKNDKALLKNVKSTKSTAEAFEIMRAAIGRVEDPTKKASLAAATFGRAGIDMVNMINLSSKEVEKLRGQMRENGIVTEQQAAEAEAYVDTMNRVKRTVGTLLVTVFVPLMPVIKDLAERFRKWGVENRSVISEKFKKGLAWTIKNFSEIVKWLKRIGTAIVVFYSLSAAIKVASVAMTIFNAACNINLGPLKALNRSIGAIPGQTAAATGAVGGLQSAFYALGAFAAGWGIGTILYEKLVKPFMEARHQARLLREEHLHTMSGDLEKKNSAVLEGDLNRVKKIIDQEKRALPSSKRTSAFVGGMAAMYGGSSVVESGDATLRRLEADKAKITKVYNRKKYDSSAPMSDEWSSGIEAESRWMPSVTTHREVVEVRIKDDSGKAEVTKGKHSKTVKMERGRRRPLTPVHTGWMP
jgi:hypothetical protein